MPNWIGRTFFCCGLVCWGAAPVHAQDCPRPDTSIGLLQALTPLPEEVSVRGLVSADFREPGRLGGFFLQNAPADSDGDPRSSDALFVVDPEGYLKVSAGLRVTLRGRPRRLGAGMRLVQAVVQGECGPGRIEATPVFLPVADGSTWQSLLGMLVAFPQTLSVTGNHRFGTEGVLDLSSGGRLFQPTAIRSSGLQARAQAARNRTNRIALDDGRLGRNLPPAYWTPFGVPRAGDQIRDLAGIIVLHTPDPSNPLRGSEIRLNPVGPLRIDPINPRPASPRPVGGDFRVAAFNVLNFFNGDGKGGGFPTARGASSKEEFERQQDKIVSALRRLGADVVGLIEVENDGNAADSSIQALVDALNRSLPEALEYDFVRYLAPPGGDVIRQAIIYRTKRVRPVGKALAPGMPPFDRRRPPLAQAFEHLQSGERISFVVNHFKSKGCGAAGDAEKDPNADQGDGQGCWNAERLQASIALVDWLAGDPFHLGDPDVLIVGDLNAQPREDPLRLLREAGFVDLVQERGEEQDRYSFIFRGESGRLDYILASRSLALRCSGATVWHINADESRLVDYNLESKPRGVYLPDPYRSSDHDPVVVGFNLRPLVR